MGRCLESNNPSESQRDVISDSIWNPTFYPSPSGTSYQMIDIE